MARRPEPFNDIASLTLFREPDGTHEITVSAGSATVMTETPDDLRPIDHFENIIISAARRMEARKRADGTYRDISA